eukprot:5571755-Pyramimonas_sp.AAC.1
MAASGHFGTPLTRIVAPQEFHRRRQLRGSHGGPGPLLRAPHKDRGPMVVLLQQPRLGVVLRLVD